MHSLTAIVASVSKCTALDRKNTLSYETESAVVNDGH